MESIEPSAQLPHSFTPLLFSSPQPPLPPFLPLGSPPFSGDRGILFDARNGCWVKSCRGSRWQSWWNLGAGVYVFVCVRSFVRLCVCAHTCVCVYRWGVGAGQCQHYGRAVIRPTTEHVPGQCHTHRRKQPPNKGLKKRDTERDRESEEKGRGVEWKTSPETRIRPRLHWEFLFRSCCAKQ